MIASQRHVHGHELTAMDVTAVATADNAGGPVTSTSHDEAPTSSFSASSTCMVGLASKRPRSVEYRRLLLLSTIILQQYLNYSRTLSDQLFLRTSHIQTHVLKPLLPTDIQHSYNLRDRSRTYSLINKDSILTTVIRLLYKHAC